MRTALRQAWMHVKYTNSALHSKREQIEAENVRVRKWEERPGLRTYSIGTIVDPALAKPDYTRFQNGADGLKFRYTISLAILAILAVMSLIVVLGLGGRSLVHNIDHRECPRKAAALGVAARWVD